MKAFAKTSPSDQLTQIEVDSPGLDPHDLLVKVRAIGVGVHDRYFHPANPGYPYTIGIEASGVVEQIGDAVTRFSPGQRITFINAMNPKGGTWAEYTAVQDSALIIPIPDAMTFEKAAGIPVAGNTILKAFRATELKPGDTLFIAGGSGAIGTLAIQIAAQRGIRIAASASKKNHDYMRSLGADLTADYHDSDWQEQVQRWAPDGVDAAIAIQPGTASQSEPLVKDGGTIVAVSGDQFAPSRQIKLEQIPHHLDVTDELTDLTRQIAAGKIQLTIENVYPFSDALQALEKVETRHSRGKQIISLP